MESWLIQGLLGFRAWREQAQVITSGLLLKAHFNTSTYVGIVGVYGLVA